MLKVALVGFGQVAEKAHVPAWKESKDFSVVAVADERAERLALAREYFPGVRPYPSMETLLRAESHIDLVDIATPPFLHAKQCVLALQHRCHVLCEKPLALAMQDFESIRAQAQAQNRMVFTAHNWKYSPLYLQAAQLLRAKAIGALTHVELHTLRSQPAPGVGSWRLDRIASGGGILVDHGWHNFYLLHTLLEQEPRTISARLQIPRYGGVEEEATCFIEYPQVSALLYLTWRSPYRSNWGIFYGQQGSLEMRDDLLLLTRGEGETQRFEFAQKLSQGSAHPDWFQTMLEDVRSEIQKPKLRRNLREAGVCLAMLSHVYQSHRLGGKSVALPLSGLPRSETIGT